MDDRILVTRLLEIGVTARRSNPESYAEPADDTNLRDIGVATIAHWLAELGRHRLIGSVQPCFTSSKVPGLNFKSPTRHTIDIRCV